MVFFLHHVSIFTLPLPSFTQGSSIYRYRTLVLLSDLFCVCTSLSRASFASAQFACHNLLCLLPLCFLTTRIFLALHNFPYRLGEGFAAATNKQKPIKKTCAKYNMVSRNIEFVSFNGRMKGYKASGKHEFENQKKNPWSLTTKALISENAELFTFVPQLLTQVFFCICTAFIALT